MRQNNCPACGRKIKRSNEANARYWALLHKMSQNIKTLDGKFSVAVWHEYFKSKYLGCDEIKLPNRKTLLITRSSSDLDTEEFCVYQTKVEVFAHEHNVYLDE